MDKLIISGNGKKHLINVFMLIISSIIGIISGGYMIYLSDQTRKSDNKQVFIIVGVIFICLGVFNVFSIIKNAFMAKTKINVYDNYITGDGLEKIPFSLQNFKLTYGQISNVDVIKKTAIVIYTPYTKYTCYISNGIKIRDIILKNKQMQE